MGATVTGIDAVEQSIHVARLHAALDPAVAQRADYRAVTAEQLVTEGAPFDAVLSLEARARHPAPCPLSRPRHRPSHSSLLLHHCLSGTRRTFN
jgi:hypothetical protein